MTIRPLDIFGKGNFNTIQFLAVFALLSFAFYAYIGVTVPGGKIYFPVLAHYFDVVSWFAALLAHGAGALLTLLGYAVKYTYPARLSFATGGGGVSIGYSCLGVQIMAFWIAFVTAHTAAAWYKMKWMAGGVAAIVLLNMMRIALVSLATHNHYISILPFDHHTCFNICAYIVVFILLYYFIRSNNKQQTQAIIA
ncbi:exosortase/archaeosortase family protein [Ilyomonas limi]|uniref:Exosortase/archaeosortase family protein n=1 Tax=Ilyomonas limi TaxID=2575867 RepID=A0A4U3KZV7_9BACT|nr:exosortase/archaeosortase family protein [Ilyomonas limi]TKK68215.1 exosortase/archaeosortase family protein [Ilyomonas limi]